MQQYLPMKICSWLLLVVMLIATIHCGCAQAHGTDGKFKAGAEVTSISATDGCPCCPQGDHHSSGDNSDACGGCGCHAALLLPLFQLSYHPVLSDHQASSPIKQLPEVYLSRFIPPQNLV
jgi:hypothetical protein